ncbi:MAG: EamA family transporter [Flavobacteriales bacterium]|nr:MAG: EamA family transporter [Flavobacteriales bacterium]
MGKPITSKSNALLALHIAVFIWGFTAILGKLISYNSFTLVWHRMLITALVYLLIPSVWRQLKGLPLKTMKIFLGIGLIVCAHWLTFYGSIKLGNSVSITLACLGSATFFAAIIEPIAMKTPFSKQHILLGLVVMLGILLIYLSLPQSKVQGVSNGLAILTGLLSALLAASFTILNKQHINKAPALAISTLEMISGAVLLTAILPFIAEKPCYFWPTIDIHLLHLNTLSSGEWDGIWVIILALVCTNLTFYLGTYSLQYLSAFTCNLTVNLEPIYGIILGALIFHENKSLNPYFYLGAGIIVLAIFAQAWLSRKG